MPYKGDNMSYNGWTNHATWNIALHINNVEKWYNISRQSTDYHDFQTRIQTDKTPDGIKLCDGNYAELDEVIQENR